MTHVTGQRIACIPLGCVSVSDWSTHGGLLCRGHACQALAAAGQEGTSHSPAHVDHWLLANSDVWREGLEQLLQRLHMDDLVGGPDQIVFVSSC